MRNFIRIGIVVLASVGLCFGLWASGVGGVLSATTTPQSFTVTGTANVVSVYNAGTAEIVYCLVDSSDDSVITTTNTLAAAIAAGTAVPIPPSTIYNFDAREKGAISHLLYATTNGTSAAYVAAY